MIKLIHKKVSQEETPYLLLERRHTFKDLSHVLDDFDPRKVERSNSVGSAAAIREKATVERVHSRSESDRQQRPPIADKPKLRSSPSTIIVTENELAASKLFLDKRAQIKPDEAASDTTSSTSNETVSDSRPILSSNLIAKSAVTPEKPRPKKITCCCYAGIVAVIFLVTLVLMLAIGGVAYMELFARHNETITERIKEVYVVKDEFVNLARSRGKFMPTPEESNSLADSISSREGSPLPLRDELPVKEPGTSIGSKKIEKTYLNNDPNVAGKNTKGERLPLSWNKTDQKSINDFLLNSGNVELQASDQNSKISKSAVADFSGLSTKGIEVTLPSSKFSAGDVSMNLPEISNSASLSADIIDNDTPTSTAEGDSNAFVVEGGADLQLQNDELPGVSSPSEFESQEDDESLQPSGLISEEEPGEEQSMSDAENQTPVGTFEEISPDENSASKGEPVPESVLFHPVVESKAVPVPLDFLKRIGFEIKNLNPHQTLTAQDMDVKFSLAEALKFLRSMDENSTSPAVGQPLIHTTARSARTTTTRRKTDIRNAEGEQGHYLDRLRHIMYD